MSPIAEDLAVEQSGDMGFWGHGREAVHMISVVFSGNAADK
jgi:hypothetical protein